MGGLKAAIIAGGQGTRIRAISGDAIPKALVPVAGEPIVFRQFELLQRHGVQEIAMMAGYLSDVLLDAVRPKMRELGLTLHPFVEPEALGTAGALGMAREYLADGDFLVLYGDIAIEMDLNALAQFHVRNRAILTVVAHPNDHPHESDLLVADSGGLVSEVLYRGTRTPGYYRNLVPSAVYCCSPRVFEHIAPDKKQDFIKDLIPCLLARGESVYAYNTTEYLRDMGTVARYELVEHDIETGLMSKMNRNQKRPTIFLDRDGVLNEERDWKGVTEADELTVLPGAAEAVKLINDAAWLAVVVTNQPQIAKGFTTEAELDRIFAKLETELGFGGAKLDRVYYCPHHPEQGFEGEIPELKIACDCRKPRPGMILRATEELPVDMHQAYLVGDRKADIALAREVGIGAFGVRTGYGCQDCSAEFEPELMFHDVLEAASFAVHGIPAARELALDINETIRQSEAPLRIAIGGRTLAGKTCFAFDLCRRLKAHGHDAVRLSIGAPLGESGSEVIVTSSRGPRMPFRSVSDFLDLIAYESAPSYQDLLGGRPAVVIVIDGGLPAVRDASANVDRRVYLDIAPEILDSRRRALCAWRGLEAEATTDYLTRVQQEESELAAAQRQAADIVIVGTTEGLHYDHNAGAV